MTQKINYKLLILGVLLLGFVTSNAQDPNRFKDYVDELNNSSFAL